ncbi:MAG: D-proline reductase (dithiol) PrdB [Acidobacteriota bacterium]|jgi:D-proline reductase (dithiol) PrdB|nr:D-proline reductase (dithiol) PrdB [Acidobacteriota bacterium]
MIDELREKIRAQYKPDFDFTTVGDVPFTAPGKPAASSRIALISTAGLHLDDQEPFDRTTPAGDCSYRRIGAGDDLARLRIWWDTDQHQPGSQDLNSAFPLALLRDKYDLAATHYSFSGAIPDPRPLLEQSAPAVATELNAGAVDAVLIAPS